MTPMPKNIFRNIALAMLLIAFSATFACSPAPLKVDTAAMIESAKKLDEQFLDAFNKRDAESMSALDRKSTCLNSSHT